MSSNRIHSYFYFLFLYCALVDRTSARARQPRVLNPSQSSWFTRYVSFYSNKNLQKTSPRVLRRVRISTVPRLIFCVKPPTRSFPFPLQIFKGESFAYNASNDAIQADAQLEAVVQEWETRMESFKVVVERRFSDELNPTVYPQVGFSRRRQPKTGIPKCTPGLHKRNFAHL